MQHVREILRERAKSGSNDGRVWRILKLGSSRWPIQSIAGAGAYRLDCRSIGVVHLFASNCFIYSILTFTYLLVHSLIHSLISEFAMRQYCIILYAVENVPKQ